MNNAYKQYAEWLERYHNSCVVPRFASQKITDTCFTVKDNTCGEEFVITGNTKHVDMVLASLNQVYTTQTGE